MPIGNPNMTRGPMSDEAKETAPGMAYFSGTGPAGTTCGDCQFRGYRRKRRPIFDARTNDWIERSVNHNGCKKFKELTGSHGQVISSLLHSCKYFEEICR